MQILESRSAGLFAAVMAPGAAHAACPDRPITPVVPSAPGGGMDITARIPSQALSRARGHFDKSIGSARPCAGLAAARPARHA